MRATVTDLMRMASKKSSSPSNYPRSTDFYQLFAGKAFSILAFAVPADATPAAYSALLLISMRWAWLQRRVSTGAHSGNVDHPLRGATDHNEWVIHQIRTTSNFAAKNWLVSFSLGGLNFQREHHLFPKVSHVHYPEIAKVIREVCEEHHVEVCESPSMWQAMRSHYRFVRAMGAKPA